MIGASNDEVRPGGRIVTALLRFGFSGRIFPVNPKQSEVQGLPCYASISDIGRPVDFAVVLVAAKYAADVVTECTNIGVPLVMVGAAGFQETGLKARNCNVTS